MAEQRVIVVEALPHDPKRQKVREWRWWERDPHKLTNLEYAFGIGCTDKEACGFADISERQLYYYERMHPDFVRRKEVLKDGVILKAKAAIASEVGKSYANAMDYLKRRNRDEFGDSLDLTSKGKQIHPNAIVFVDFTGEQNQEPIHAESQSKVPDSIPGRE